MVMDNDQNSYISSFMGPETTAIPIASNKSILTDCYLYLYGVWSFVIKVPVLVNKVGRFLKCYAIKKTHGNASI